jgi:class 3 adenylate cyclase
MADMKFLKACKKIIYKLCGKARWLLLTAFILLVVSISISVITPLYRYTMATTDDYDHIIHEYPLQKAGTLSINNSGDMAVYCDQTPNGVAGFINIDTGDQGYCGIGVVSGNGFANGDSVLINNFALTDSGDLYAVYETNTEDIVVRVSGDYVIQDSVFTIAHDASDRLNGWKLSALHYFDGYVTFAKIDMNGVTLYSIDTATQAVSTSRLYETDPNGTCTVKVIPVDGSFLFLRNDGNVYDVRFDEPIGESIYYFDPADSGHPFFDDAVISNGKIYVAVDGDPVTVYLLENGELTEVFDTEGVIDDPGCFVSIESYRPQGASEDSLVISFERGLLTYNGELIARNILLRPNNTPLMYFAYWVSYMFFIPIIGLIINLIIRRKTLLYKQLIITIPVFVILAIAMAVSIYNRADIQKQAEIEKDITSVCDLATDNFRGYDFSKLMTLNEDTGAAYQELRSELAALGSGADWSEGYEFSIIYISDDGHAYLIASDYSLEIPMLQEVILDEGFDRTSDLNLSSNMNGIIGLDALSRSNICAYGKIADTDSSGDYYLKVSEDIYFLYIDRSELWGLIAVFSFIIVFVLIILIILSMLLITGVIKKATKTVKRIADGDLSARINYKSKDELGEICNEVNDMAINLEKSFEEKDRTEKFYYKFVPEKFREYLGKESFTDLALGDASSRELTVLFCDIRSFSINSEIMTAKENFAFVNTIYGKAGPIIREHNGFVDKYIGDAVMALFEKPDDAIKAAADLYRAIVLNPDTAKELKVSDINIGIGIHTGMAMIGIVGESERLSGTVISDTVNLSSRLESLTKQYKTAILVSKDTVDRLAAPEDLDIRYLGMIQVAGVNEVKGVYEILDCLKDEEKELRSGNSVEFREAMRLFQLGRREDAAKALEKLSDEGRADYVTTMYLEYIRSLSPEDKGNVFRFVRK